MAAGRTSVGGCSARVSGVGFARVALEPEETKRVRIPLDLTALHHRIAPGEWTRRDGDWRIAVASHSRDTGTDTGTDTRAVF